MSRSYSQVHDQRTMTWGIWRVLLAASLGFLLIGGVVAMVTRLAMERQLQGWVEAWLRSSAASRAVLVERNLGDYRETTVQFAGRAPLRQQLARHMRGEDDAAQLEAAAAAGFATAREQSPALAGMVLVDHRGLLLLTLGAAPADALAALADPRAVVALLPDGSAAMRSVVEARDGEGRTLGTVVAFHRFTAMAEMYQRSYGYGPTLDRRLAALVGDRALWVLPAGAMDAADEALYGRLLRNAAAAGSDQAVPVRRAGGPLGAVCQPLPRQRMLVTIDISPEQLPGGGQQELVVVTLVIGALVVAGTGLLLLLLRPVVRRTLSQAQQLERTLADLRRSEERLRIVVTATNDAIWDWDMADGSLWWNDGVATLFGYSPHEIGRSSTWWEERLHPEDAPRVIASLRQAVAGRGSEWSGEYRFRCADGTFKPVLDRGHVMRDAHGTALRMLGAMLDLSERRRVEALEQRRAAQAELRADIGAALLANHERRPLLQACADAAVRRLGALSAGIWIADAAGTVLDLEAASGLPRTPDGTLDHVPTGTFLVGRVAAQRAPLVTGALRGDPLAPPGTGDGQAVFTGLPLLSDGALVGVLALMTREALAADALDALEFDADLIAQGLRRKAAERALAERTATLQATNGELEQFTYVVSHDLQEPLRTIANYLGMLERRYHQELDDKARRYIAHSVAAANRLQALIRDLLAYSKAAHREGAVGVEVATEEVLAEVLAALESAITEAGATVTAGPLPVVAFDRLHLAQLFQNLIGNALKYRSAVPPVIAVTARRGEGCWVFSVADNGIGIDPAYHGRIFEVFQRLHGRDEYHGTGIGLALCRKVVTTHGGRIWVESRPGGGSVFLFTIPDAPATGRHTVP